MGFPHSWSKNGEQSQGSSLDRIEGSGIDLSLSDIEVFSSVLGGCSGPPISNLVGRYPYASLSLACASTHAGHTSGKAIPVLSSAGVNG